ncbi:MAG: class I SAM-dependent methyltransferase [Caulobacteraceae bacterium]
MSQQIDRSFGRKAFGADPANYDRARPSYPDWVFERLARTAGLGPGAAALEIGAGTGTASRALLARGADPLVAVEPDARSAEFLRQSDASPALTVRAEPFETANLPAASFDLAASFTAFHWLDEAAALAKIAAALKPGGWWAPCWNVFGDDAYPDAFHEATTEVLNGPRSPSQGLAGVGFAVDAQRRIAAIDATGGFERANYYTSHWPLVLDADETVALYATYSNIAVRPDRAEVLAELRRIAQVEFGGRVVRNMTTILYLARRR